MAWSFLAHEREGADGDGFLSDVKMQEAAHFPLLVELERGLLEAADAEHVGEEAEFLLGGEVGVDGGLGVVDRTLSGFFWLFGSGDAHVWVNRVCLRVAVGPWMRTAIQRVRTKEKEWGNLRVLANRNGGGKRRRRLELET